MTFHAFVMLCVDLLFVATATVGGVMLRDDFDLSLERMQSVTPHLLFSMVTAALAVTAFGQHRAIWRMATRFDYVRIIYVALVTVIGACALGFVWNRLEGVPRSLPLLQFGLMIGLMGGVREVVRLLYHRRQDVAKAGEVGKAVVARRAQILIVGLNPIAELYLRGVEEVGEAVEVVGILGRSERHIGRRVMACPVLGMPEDVEEVVRELEVEGVDVDRIVITVPDGKLSEAAHEALRRVERTGIALHRIAEGIGLGRSEPTTASRQGLCRDGIAEYSVAERALVSGNRYLRVKRWLDAVAALLLMAVLSPIYALVGLLALVDVGLPVLFSQRRPGRFGRPFRIYKFRTMSPATTVTAGGSTRPSAAPGSARCCDARGSMSCRSSTMFSSGKCRSWGLGPCFRLTSVWSTRRVSSCGRASRDGRRWRAAASSRSRTRRPWMYGM